MSADIVKAPWEEPPSSPEPKGDVSQVGRAAAAAAATAAAAAAADGGGDCASLPPSTLERNTSIGSYSTDGQVGHDAPTVVSMAEWCHMYLFLSLISTRTLTANNCDSMAVLISKQSPPHVSSASLLVGEAALLRLERLMMRGQWSKDRQATIEITPPPLLRVRVARLRCSSLS